MLLLLSLNWTASIISFMQYPAFPKKTSTTTRPITLLELAYLGYPTPRKKQKRDGWHILYSPIKRAHCIFGSAPATFGIAIWYLLSRNLLCPRACSGIWINEEGAVTPHYRRDCFVLTPWDTCQRCYHSFPWPVNSHNILAILYPRLLHLFLTKSVYLLCLSNLAIQVSHIHLKYAKHVVSTGDSANMSKCIQKVWL